MPGTVVVVDVALELVDEIQARTEASIETLPDAAAAIERVGRAAADLAAVVLGPRVTSPVETVQRLGTMDGELAVVVLTADDDVEGRRRELQFAPFLGEDVTCRAVGAPEPAATAIAAAADRTVRRRTHRATMRAAGAQLGPGLHVGGSAVTVQGLGTLLDQAPVGIVTLDDQSRVVSVNRYAERLLDSDAGSLARRPLEDRFPAESRARLAVMLQPSTPLFPSPTRRFGRRRADGREQELDITAARFRSPLGAAGTILLLQDATDAAAGQRRLRRHARALHDDVIASLVAAHEATVDGEAGRAALLIAATLERARALALELDADAGALQAS